MTFLEILSYSFTQELFIKTKLIADIVLAAKDIIVNKIAMLLLSRSFHSYIDQSGTLEKSLNF